MSFNPIIALLLGLLIQLSQVQLCSGGAASPSCPDMADSVSCCEGMKSCHCVTDNDTDQKPTPLAMTAVDLKVHLSKAPENDQIPIVVCLPDDSVLTGSPAIRDYIGFAGVPLCVAFCCFVI